ncbi:MAG TPA: MBL fold metallo-hydrolase [Chloroflexota bacterium]|nr:MBL fold metallo-hydrolase [Chloroflexota bacterium]
MLLMRVDFLGHATLLVRLGELSILTDPWWSGPAYRGQWYPYPLPVPERFDLRELDAVYISHGHEDHLHRETLSEVLRAAPNVLAVIPQRYDTGMRDYLRRIGFRRIREVPGGTHVDVRRGPLSARLRVFTHMDDSMLSIESGGQVLLNANDALHASRRELIEEYCRVLRRRLPRIDYLFCGFGGASYFPNCIHVPGKDDVTVARAREIFFLRNFALITDRLQPRQAFPFAAHFVLPDAHNWWISETRLQMAPPAEAVRRLAPELRSEVHDLQPGDWIESGTVHASAYPGIAPERARREVVARYGQPPAPAPLTSAQYDRLVDATRARATQRARTLGPSERLDAVLRLWDHPAADIRVVVADQRADVAPTTSTNSDTPPEVILGTRSDLLWAMMQTPFGRDLLTVGYAVDIRLRSIQEMANNAHERLLNLLAYPQPRWRERFRRQPGRVLGFLLGDPSMRYALKSKLGLARSARIDATERGLYAISDWAELARTPE